MAHLLLHQYLFIMLLECSKLKIYRYIHRGQAGFIPSRSYNGQVLALTNYIEIVVYYTYDLGLTAEHTF